MRPFNLASVFLVVICCSTVSTVEIVSGKKPKDLHKFSMSSASKINAKSRFRRETKDDPDVINVNEAEGVCRDPTSSGDKELKKFDVS